VFNLNTYRNTESKDPSYYNCITGIKFIKNTDIFCLYVLKVKIIAKFNLFQSKNCYDLKVKMYLYLIYRKDILCSKQLI